MPGSVAWGSLYPLAGPTGQVTLLASSGVAVATLTDPRITAQSVILAQIQTIDATATRVVVTPGAGVATFTFNAVPTGNIVVGYVICNPSTVG